MPFNFPDNPGVNAQVTNDTTGVTYQWDSTAQTWVVVHTSAVDDFVTDVELQAETSARESADGIHDVALENLAIESSDHEARITAIEVAPNPTPLTYQIGTDKVMLRSGDPSIELVDSEGYYSNVKFRGLGGVSVTSDLNSIIIDGSDIDAGDADVQLGLIFSSTSVNIKVNSSLEKGVEIPSANRYAAGVLTSADWNKLTGLGGPDDYYTKDEIDDQFRYRGLGYRYTFDSANGQVQVRPGKFNTDSHYANQIQIISLAPEDYDGKTSRFAVPGDKIELVSPSTGAAFQYTVTTGNAGTYGVEFQGTTSSTLAADEIITPLNDTIYTFYIYPTHINAADYYTKTQSNNLYLKKTEGTTQTLKANVKYTGLMTDTQHLIHKGYVDSQVAGALASVQESDYATVTYVNGEVDKALAAFSTEDLEPDIFYGDYSPAGEMKNGNVWFDSMNLRMNVWSQGAWINPDRNDGRDLEDRITALEARIAQLEGN